MKKLNLKPAMLAGLFMTSFLPGVLSTVPVSAATTSSLLTHNSPTLSGVVGHGDPTKTANFQSWRGQKLQVIDDYTSTSTWASIDGFSAQQLASHWSAFPGVQMVWSVPMLPTNESATIQIGATGAYNNYFKILAQQMVNDGQGSAVIRLGWENTYPNAFKWSGVADPTSYAEYWRQIVNSMRSVPNQHFLFDFNTGDLGIDPRPLYPGDNYVDFIGNDLYDNSWAWSYPATDHVDVWKQKTQDMAYNINWLYNWAESHGKRFSLPEWGEVYRCDDDHDGGDDPYFVQQLHNWIATHDVAYETYFNNRDSSCHYFELQSGSFPNAANAYQQLWGQPFTSPTGSGGSTTTPTPIAPTNNSYTLVTTGGKALNGASVSSTDPIYIAANSAIHYVLFSVDGTFIDDDWAGSGDFSLNTGSLKAGTHTVSAIVVGNDGSRTTVTATYTQAAASTQATGYSLLTTGGKALDGTTITSSDPVYIPANSALHYVLFSVDGTFIDDDWAGSGDFNLTTSKVGSGKHTVSAIAVGYDGSRTTVAATYMRN